MTREDSQNEIYQLISDGEKKIDGNSFKEVILFVGITGSGKTTLTQFLAGDNDKLFSVAVDEETADETGEFLIIDNDKISNSTITSKTLYPEAIVDADTHEVLVDCPGFSDTRSTNYDIAATIFTKYLIDNVNAVKVVLVVN
jgi:energy-coupling factor transporter ATP-binding protein EcfA2